MFQVMSVLPFSAKNAFVTAFLLESSLASSVQKCRVLYSNYFNRLLIFSSMKENKKFTDVFTRNISELAVVKLVM